VFAFASLWFAHYALAALQRMRAVVPVEVLDADPARVRPVDALSDTQRLNGPESTP
jgi:hypothetical protein